MASVRSAGTTTYATRTNTTIPAPAGIVDGDVLWLCFVLYHATAPPTATLPSGFDLVVGFPDTIIPAGSERIVMYMARKVAAGESGDYVVTHTSATTQGCILANIGGDAALPIATLNTGGDDTPLALTITPDADQSVVIYAASNYDGFSVTTPPAGTDPTFSEYLDGVIMYVAAGVLSPAGATGNKSVVADGSGGTVGWQATLTVIEAAVAGATFNAHLVTTGGWVF